MQVFLKNFSEIFLLEGTPSPPDLPCKPFEKGLTENFLLIVIDIGVRDFEKSGIFVYGYGIADFSGIVFII